MVVVIRILTRLSWFERSPSVLDGLEVISFGWFISVVKERVTTAPASDRDVSAVAQNQNFPVHFVEAVYQCWLIGSLGVCGRAGVCHLSGCALYGEGAAVWMVLVVAGMVSCSELTLQHR